MYEGPLLNIFARYIYKHALISLSEVNFILRYKNDAITKFIIWYPGLGNKEIFNFYNYTEFYNAIREGGGAEKVFVESNGAIC